MYGREDFFQYVIATTIAIANNIVNCCNRPGPWHTSLEPDKHGEVEDRYLLEVMHDPVLVTSGLFSFS